mmetsp:Transcript_40065/g.99296  ORF Transcript_40065/g.99296 Transcript_40065/m.99296 type:complete len:255 (-) Transcript_40065:351-1115(-)
MRCWLRMVALGAAAAFDWNGLWSTFTENVQSATTSITSTVQSAASTAMSSIDWRDLEADANATFLFAQGLANLAVEGAEGAVENVRSTNWSAFQEEAVRVGELARDAAQLAAAGGSEELRQTTAGANWTLVEQQAESAFKFSQAMLSHAVAGAGEQLRLVNWTAVGEQLHQTSLTSAAALREAALSAAKSAQAAAVSAQSHSGSEPSEHHLMKDVHADSASAAPTQTALVCAVFLTLALLAKLSHHHEKAVLML